MVLATCSAACFQGLIPLLFLLSGYPPLPGVVSTSVSCFPRTQDAALPAFPLVHTICLGGQRELLVDVPPPEARHSPVSDNDGTRYCSSLFLNTCRPFSRGRNSIDRLEVSGTLGTFIFIPRCRSDSNSFRPFPLQVRSGDA